MASLRRALPEDKASFLSLLVAGAGLSALGLSLGCALFVRVAPLVTQACLEICAAYPALMARMGDIPPATAVMAGLFLLPILVGTVALAVQLLATRRLVQGIRDKRGMLPAKLRRAAKRVGLGLNRVEYVRDAGLFALCHGFFFPRVCVSRGLVRSMSKEELEAVLLHEAYHLRQRDPLRTLVSRSLSCALFFVPIVRHFADRYLVYRELAADAWALRRVGRSVMASAFLKIVGSPNQPGLAAVGAMNVTDERLRRLLNPETATDVGAPGAQLGVSVLVTVALIVGLGLFLSYPAQSASAQGPACAARHAMECSFPAVCCANRR
ncbi:MAG: M56 family metallopeptidase [Chloroflexi bacterium]|nr:M56 family metallopeptidase [Chloroflexota bacterium]